MAKLKDLMLGALAGSMIASTFALLGSRETLLKKLKNQSQDWADKARNVKENVLEGLTESRKSRLRKTFLFGTVLGFLMGSGSAAFLTPKTGRQLRKNVTQKYHDVADTTQDIMEFINQNGYRKPLKKLSRSLVKRRKTARAKV